MWVWKFVHKRLRERDSSIELDIVQQWVCMQRDLLPNKMRPIECIYVTSMCLTPL